MHYDQLNPENSILSFSEEVMRRTRMGKGMTFSDAIISLAEENEMEIELAAKLLTPEVTDLYRLEAETHHLVRPQQNRIVFT